MRRESVGVVMVMLLSWAPVLLPQNTEGIVHPAKITSCVEGPEFRKALLVDTGTNPYYLRGDFDGDGVMDFAVAVKGIKTTRNGVLICRSNGPHVLLGADKNYTPPFSDMPDDNFVAPAWEVATRSEILELRKTNPSVPLPKGESILMIWEDGIHYIYWDGKQFRWSPMMQ
jgi:hypothetical protein